MAMVLAEVVAQGGFFDIAELDEPELRIDRPRTFRARACREGVAIGRVVLHEPRVKVERMIADNPQAELKRLEEALSGLRDVRRRDAGFQRARSDRRKPRSDRGLSPVRVGPGLAPEACATRCAPASRPKPPSSACRTKCACGCSGWAIRSCASGCTISTIWRGACSAISAARALGRHARSAAKRRSRGARDGAGGTARLWTRRLVALRAGRRHRHLACRHRGALDGTAACRSELEGIADTARAGDPIVVDGETGEAHLRPPAEIVSAFEARRDAARAGAVAHSPPCAICPPSRGMACPFS